VHNTFKIKTAALLLAVMVLAAMFPMSSPVAYAESKPSNVDSIDELLPVSDADQYADQYIETIASEVDPVDEWLPVGGVEPYVGHELSMEEAMAIPVTVTAVSRSPVQSHQPAQSVPGGIRYGYNWLADPQNTGNNSTILTTLYEAFVLYAEAAYALNETYTVSRDPRWYHNGSIDIRNLNIPYDGYRGTGENLILLAYTTFRNDNPQYYMISSNYDYSMTSLTDGFFVTFTPLFWPEYADPAVRLTCQARIEEKYQEYVSLISTVTADYDTVRLVHDKMLAERAYSYINNSTDQNPYAHNILGVMDTTTNGPVCESFVMAFSYLLHRLGVGDAITVVGWARSGQGSGSGAHAWSLVKIGGIYYYVDPTWDNRDETRTTSTNYDYGGQVNDLYYKYFMVGSGNTDFGAGNDSSAIHWAAGPVPVAGYFDRPYYGLPGNISANDYTTPSGYKYLTDNGYRGRDTVTIADNYPYCIGKSALLLGTVLESLEGNPIFFRVGDTTYRWNRGPYHCGTFALGTTPEIRLYNWAYDSTKTGISTAFTGTVPLILNTDYRAEAEPGESGDTIRVWLYGIGEYRGIDFVTITLDNAQTPMITAQPLRANYAQNEAATALSVTASNFDGGLLSYQWYANTVNSVLGGEPISGANASTFIPATNTPGTVYYYVAVTNTNENVPAITTATATSVAVPVNVSVPVIDITDAPTTALSGIDLTLSATVVPGNATQQTIVWTLRSTINTTASISGNTLSAKGAGTVVVRATIIDGVKIGTSYTKDFEITVTLPLGIAEFSIPGSVKPALIDNEAGTIDLFMEAGTDLKSLTPEIVYWGSSISPSSGVTQNFTNPVVYTVTAESGDTKTYLVTVVLDTICYISSFTVEGTVGPAVINQTEKTIKLYMLGGTALDSLSPVIDIWGASVTPGSEVRQDFRSPVTYTVTAANGNTVSYVVTVRIAAADGIGFSGLYQPSSATNLTNKLERYFYFGSYLDGAVNRPRPWYVIGEEDGALVLMQRYGYANERMAFHSVSTDALTWSQSDIYRYLNNAGNTTSRFADFFLNGELDSVRRTDVKTIDYVSGGANNYLELDRDSSYNTRFYLLSCNSGGMSPTWSASLEDNANKVLRTESSSINGANEYYWFRSVSFNLLTNSYTSSRAYRCNIQGDGLSFSELAPLIPTSLCHIRPVFKLDPNVIIFVSEIGGGGIGAMSANTDYLAGTGNGSNYKLTVIGGGDGAAVGTLAGVKSGTVYASSNGYLLSGLNAVPAGEGNYTINYKIVQNNNGVRGIVGYGSSSNLTNVNIETNDLEDGGYMVYVWLQKNNTVQSHEATMPQYFTLMVGGQPPPGVTVSGQIKSYHPQHETTLELWRAGETEAIYSRTIPAAQSGSGQWTQDFAFPGVEPGTYTLVISKPAHTNFTVRNIVVAGRDTDLRQDSRPEVQLMTLRCGDINGDGNINNSDLTILWQQANYNRSAAAADNKLCDLNGDGLINNIDLTILWLAYNYNRGAVEIN
jgi:hypothetical protein